MTNEELENQDNSPVVLLLLDGWGIKEESEANAISLAQTPNFEELVKSYPSTSINNIENSNLFYRYLSLSLGREINQESDINGFKSFPEIISEQKLKQFYITETEKFALLDIALQASKEKELKYKDTKLIPSFLEEEYRESPGLQSERITEEFLQILDQDIYNFLTLNLGNIDLVANTSDIQATTKAVEIVDKLLLKIANKVLDKNGTLIISSATGKAEEMFDLNTEISEIKNTVNPVPLVVVNSEYKGKNLDWPEPPEGKLNLLDPKGSITDLYSLILHFLNLSDQEESKLIK